MKPTLPPTPLQDELDRLHGLADAFQTEYAEELSIERETFIAAKIEAELPAMEASGLTVWCRNAIVCSEATPCRKLLCEFKQNRSDVTRGCGQCRSFTVCEGGTDWNTARWKFTSTLQPFRMDA